MYFAKVKLCTNIFVINITGYVENINLLLVAGENDLLKFITDENSKYLDI